MKQGLLWDKSIRLYKMQFARLCNPCNIAMSTEQQKWPIYQMVEQVIEDIYKSKDHFPSDDYERWINEWIQIAYQNALEMLPKIRDVESMSLGMWISVKDKLPPNFSTVYAAFWIAWWMTGKLYHVRDWKFLEWNEEIPYVTHWAKISTPHSEELPL